MDGAQARDLLSRERERIERALVDLRSVRDEQDSGQFQAAGASDLLGAEIDAGVAERLREELAAVERAEQRLAQGTYGLSIQSGEPIPDGRLEAIPWAERTAEEQSRYEGR